MNGRILYYGVFTAVLIFSLVWVEPSHTDPASMGDGSRAAGQAPTGTITFPLKGDTLTIIQRPLLNIPALVTPGDTLDIECESDPATTGWAARLRRGSMVVPLKILSSTYDPSTLWWTLNAEIPPVPLHDLYDLVVTADNGIHDRTQNAVKVIMGPNQTPMAAMSLTSPAPMP